MHSRPVVKVFLLAVEQKLVSVGWLGLPKSWASAKAEAATWSKKDRFWGKMEPCEGQAR